METRATLLKTASIGERLAAQLASIKDSGRDKQWQARERASASQKASAEYELYGAGLVASAIHDVYEAGKKLDSIRRPKSLADDSAARLFHLQRAKDGLAGLEPENALLRYRETVGRLNDSEAKYRWIYEEALENSVKDKSYSHAVQVAIDAHTPPEQKEAKIELQQAEIMKTHVLTLANYIEHDIEKLSRGETPTGHDYGQLYAEMLENARRQTIPAEKRSGSKIIAEAASGGEE